MLEYIDNIDENKYNFVDYSWEEGPTWKFELDIARKGRLSDYYEYSKVMNFYKKIDFPMELIDIERFDELFYSDINELLNGYLWFNYRNNISAADYMITGLLLGYPLESTVSSIYDITNYDI